MTEGAIPVRPHGDRTFEQILAGVPVAVLVVDTQGHPWYANDAARRLLGATVDRTLSAGDGPATYGAVVAGTGRSYPSDRFPILRALAGETSTADDVELPVDGSLARVEMWAAPILDDAGAVAYAVAAFRDITERKLAEEGLHLAHELAMTIAHAPTFPEAVRVALRQVCQAGGWSLGQAWVPDASGDNLVCIPVWYGAMEALEPFHQASLAARVPRGVGLVGRVWALRRPEWTQDVRDDPTYTRPSQARDAGLITAAGVPVLAADDVVAVLEFLVPDERAEDRRFLDLVSAVGAQLGSLVQRKQMEDVLRSTQAELKRALVSSTQATRQLQRLDEVKNTVLHAVSHELQSPLAAIEGTAMVLERDEEREEPRYSKGQKRDLLTNLRGAARRANRLLKDILDLDRLTQGIVEPDRQPADLAEVVRQTVASFEPLAQRPLELDLVPAPMALDRPKVERIVENLLSNANKYSPAGTPVLVRVHPEPHGAVLSVDDRGPGVPPDRRQEIFEPFRRGEVDRDTPGLGIGLSLVARFAELHGGRAWVEDRPGGGASFRVLLRSERGPAPAGKNSSS